MGGATDATNVIKTTVLEVLASISMDHMGFLGDTLAEIAACKAGIIKPDTTVVSMRQQPEAMEVIRQVCQRQKADLRIADAANATDIVYGCEEQYFSYGGYDSLEIHLAGSYQIANAVLAVEAVKADRSWLCHFRRSTAEWSAKSKLEGQIYGSSKRAIFYYRRST